MAESVIASQPAERRPDPNVAVPPADGSGAAHAVSRPGPSHETPNRAEAPAAVAAPPREALFLPRPPEVPRLRKHRAPHLPPAAPGASLPPPYAAAYRRRLAQRLGVARLPAFLLVQPEISDRPARVRAYRRLRAVVVTWDERHLAKLTCQAAGIFGKFSPALFDGAEEMVATKTMRLFPRRRGGGTEAIHFADAERERDFLRRFLSPEVTLLHDPRANKVMLVMPLAVATLVRESSRSEALQRAFVRSSMRQVAAQLGQMHAGGTAHCDIKPANIFLIKDGTIRAADMGKASPTRRPVAGTPSYSAPELFRPDTPPPDGRVDIWSLGVALVDAIVPIRGRLFSSQEPFAIYGLHLEFEAWRRQICAEDALCPSRLAAALRATAARCILAAYFAEVSACDMDICHFVLTRMLIPADLRARAPEVERYADALQPDHSAEEHQAHAALAFHAHGPRARAVKLALRERLRDELMGEAMAAAARIVPHVRPTLRFEKEIFDPSRAPPPELADDFFSALEVRSSAFSSLLRQRVFVDAPSITIAEMKAAAKAALSSTTERVSAP